ncbi:DUF2975 domain-containing protein [uncultured Desulfobacter sp.]|uniref:DUF2975 domain-containing protein n=1 Tax=uncultured Desulfobacter sp. TaxID=240139 RepID=UPI002AA78917|nr:DUF2975 domain-containing protein [uncultured Desulfobacter sp.]
MEISHTTDANKNMDLIRKSSRRIIWTLYIWRGVIPLATCLIWLFINKLPWMTQEILPDFVQLPLPLPIRLAGLAVTMIPAGIMIYGITTLIQLFRLYQCGKIFQSENVGCLKRLSGTILVLGVTGIITNSLLSVVLTLHHPPGKHMITFSITDKDITLLILGYVLMTIARVMQEGCRLQKEQSLTV